MTAEAPLRPVSPAEVEAFHRDGAVLLRGVLAPGWVDLMAEGLDECIAAPDDHTVESYRYGSIVRVDQLLATRSDNLRRFATESPVGGLVGSVLHAPVRFYNDQMFYKKAGELAMTTWHQDTANHNTEGLGLVRAWVSPDAVPRPASLEVVRGSHRWNVLYRPIWGRDPDIPEGEATLMTALARKKGIFEKGGSDFAYENMVKDESMPVMPDVIRYRDSFDIIGWDYEPGDVIVFHGDLLHGTAEGVRMDHDRRVYGAPYAGPDVRYLRRLGKMAPDPPGLAEHKLQTGQALDCFGDVFPLVWSPGDWD